MSRRSRVRRVARELADNPVLQAFGRGGLVVSALLNLVLAAVSVTLAVGGRRDPGEGGALEQLSRLTGGVILLWIAAILLLALAAWELVLALAISRRFVSEAAERWRLRGRHALQTLVYGVLGVAAVGFALTGPDDGSASQEAVSELLGSPGGSIVVVLAGVAIGAVGVAMIVIGARRRFVDDQTDPPSPAWHRTVVIAGMTGYLGRGLAIAIIGVFWIVSAFADDPAIAGGIDVALARLAELPAGTLVLGLIALGFLGFAAFSGLRARFPRLHD